MINETFKPLLEMANLRTRETGIPGFTIYISQAEGQHGPRVKVYLANQVGRKYQSANYSISDNPQWKSGKLKVKGVYDKMIKKWIIINQEPLFKLWYSGDDVYITDILNSIKKIEGNSL